VTSGDLLQDRSSGPKKAGDSKGTTVSPAADLSKVSITVSLHILRHDVRPHVLNVSNHLTD